VGIYGYACAFSAILSLGCTAVLSYILPKIYQLLSAPKIDYKQIRIYFLYYVSFAFIVLVGIVSFTPFLYKHFINQKYFSGLNYLYLIVIGYFFFNVTYFFYAFMLYKKQKAKLIILSLISILISLTCNYFFIKSLDAAGAAISVCVSFLAVLIITLLFNRQEAKFIIFDGLLKKYDSQQ
jgi:O-antigen/teichoic acid export membrane protein